MPWLGFDCGVPCSASQTSTICNLSVVRSSTHPSNPSTVGTDSSVQEPWRHKTLQDPGVVDAVPEEGVVDGEGIRVEEEHDPPNLLQRKVHHYL